MQLPQPITIDGEQYTHVNINLAITYRTTATDDGDANAAMRLVPVRFEADGTMVANEEAATGQAIASLADGDAATATAAEAIFAAIYAYLAAKGV